VSAAATVVVCIDFRHPKAYLATQPTQALEDLLNVRFDWRPLTVRMPQPPSAAHAGDDRGTRHRRMRAHYNERDIRRYADRAGLQLGDLYRAPDASVANIALLWCRLHGDAVTRRYIDAAFQSYWDEQLELSEPETIQALLVQVDAPISGWPAYLEGPGRAALDLTQQELTQAGVFDVPGYLIEGDVFLGRQHLPMLQWMLTGRAGQPPL